MALERIGLGAVVKFDGSQAVRGMRAVAQTATQALGKARASAVSGLQGISKWSSSAATSIRNFGDQASAAVSKAGSQIRNLGLAMSVATAAMGFATSQAASFEQGMADVQAVTLSSASEMKELEALALKMGSTTKFSATESANAMELMARAGFTNTEIMKGLGGVMNAAAADGKTLQQATDAVAGVLRGMRLEASEATHVADVLALTSARTNTDLVLLGTGFSMVAAQASSMGLSLEETSGALGVISNMGIKGTAAGTALNNMLVKLAKPTSKASKLLEKYGIEIKRTEDQSLDLVGTMKSVAQGFGNVGDKVDKAGILAEVFGLRGQKATAAIEASLKDPTKGLEGLIKQLEDSQGSAQKMADIRMNTLTGQLTLLASAAEGFNIAFAKGFLSGQKEGVKALSKFIGDTAGALTLLQGGVKEGSPEFQKFGATAVAVATGIKEALDLVGGAIDWVKTNAMALFSAVFGGVGGDATKQIAKMATIFFLVAAAIGPVLVVLGTVVAFVGAVVIPAIAAIAAIGLQVFGVVLAGAIAVALQFIGAMSAAVLAGILIFEGLREKGESTGQVIVRIFNLVRKGINAVVTNAVMPFVNALLAIVVPAARQMYTAVIGFLESWRESFQETMSSWIQAVQRLLPIFRLVFRILGNVVGRFIEGAILGFRAMLAVLSPVFSMIAKIATFLVEAVMNQLIQTVQMIVSLADALPGGVGKNLIPPELREFLKGGAFEVKNISIAEATGTKPPEGTGEGFLESFLKQLKGGETGEILGKKALAAGAKAGIPKISADLNLTDQRKTEVNPCVQIDGRETNAAIQRERQTVDERNGFKSTPFQRRLILEQGATPLPGGRG